MAGQRALDNINPNAVIYWLGTNVPTRIGSYGITGGYPTRINVCIKDTATRRGWIDKWATRVRANFTNTDFDDPTYPGNKTESVRISGGNSFWIMRPYVPGMMFIVK